MDGKTVTVECPKCQQRYELVKDGSEYFKCYCNSGPPFAIYPLADLVNRPAYYTKGKIEVWDFIVDQDLNYLEGNCIKYICRYRSKNGREDLLKAQAYLEKLLKETK